MEQCPKRNFSPTLTTAENRKLVAAILNRDHLRRFCKRRSPPTPKTHHMNPSPWKNLYPFGIAENHPFSIVHGRHPRQTTDGAWQILASHLSGGPCPVEKPDPELTTSPTRRARDAILNSSQTGGAGDTYPAANLGCPIRSTDPPPFWLRRSYRLGSSLKGPFSTPPPPAPPHRTKRPRVDCSYGLSLLPRP
ncbi:hypothetical protein J6590_032945 [Homalodisca vitripennis]|nr:hypothetical protein J6590_032945 [Homalodisca vitripennis]